MSVAVRTRIPPSSLISAVCGEVSAMDRNVPIAHVATMEELAGSSVALPHLHTLLLAIFGVLALGLAAVGLYGVIAQLVAQSRHEVGVRIALGRGPARLCGASWHGR